MYFCTCGWKGEEPFVDRNGDPYDPETEFIDRCPLCFSLVSEEEEGE